jgi:site-specific DNA recombinase
MRAAIYARVSTERQERDQTIESQLTALRAWAQQHAYELRDEYVFRDEGYSGSRLDRPGLDGLRDATRDAAIDVIAVLSPDRLARKYAYQVLLLEEFRRHGCQVVFLHHPISDDPNDQLLLQIQGAIAEYERAVLAERFRRGRLQKARSGQYVGGRAPYGYQYVTRHEGIPGHLVLDETEASFVRMLYDWLIQEQMSIRQILKRLNAGPWLPRSGHRPWSPSVVHHILSDPVYTGTAYTNRFAFVPPKKPRTHKPGTAENTCRQPKPKEQWIPIPVPALIDAATYDLAQAQLARNAQRSFRNNSRYNYLLRCLLTCQSCGLAMFGRTYKATATQPERRYYLCHGKDCILSTRTTACPRRNVRAEELETAVWNHITGLLNDPAQLVAQFEQFLDSTRQATPQEQAAQQQVHARLERLSRAETRLLDAYESGVIRLEELAERRERIGEQRRALQAQQEQQQRLQQQQAHAQEVLGSLRAFSERIQTRLETASFEDKQAILQLVIERIVVSDETLEIRHVIPLHTTTTRPTGPSPPDLQLRSDGVTLTALPGQASQNGAERCLEALVVITDDQAHTAQASLHQAL